MRNIYLVGMPSSGKSTLGRRLAKEIGYTFVDLDQLIVADQEMSISEIFSKYGESFFRETESRILKSIPENKGLLVATGGGTPCFFDNMDFIRKTGLSIYLPVSPDILAERIRHHAVDDRPLLSGQTDLEAELAKKLKEREVFYNQAELTLASPDDIRCFLVSFNPDTEGK